MNLLYITFLLLGFEICINIMALLYIPYRTRKKIMSYIHGIDQEQATVIINSIVGKLDTKQIQNKISHTLTQKFSPTREEIELLLRDLVAKIEIDKGTSTALLGSLLEKVDLDQARGVITEQLAKQIGHIIGGERSGAVRASKGFDKRMVNDLLNNSEIGHIIRLFPEAAEYLKEHPAAVESVLFKWLPMLQKVRSQGGVMGGGAPLPPPPP